MSGFVSEGRLSADRWPLPIRRFYRCFDYEPSQNGLRDLVALVSLILFNLTLIFGSWLASGWIILWRLSE